MSVNKIPALSAENLKQSLWETLQGVKSRDIEPKHATAIASQSREIMRVVQAEIKIAALSGKKPKASLISGK